MLDVVGKIPEIAKFDIAKSIDVNEVWLVDISFQHTCGKLMWKTSAQWSDSKFSTVFIHISRLLKNDFNRIKTKILIKFGFPQSVNIFPSSYLIVFPMYQHSVCIE